MKRLHQISSILVALLFVFTINFKSFITVDYFFNQSEIIALFCVNKEKPELKCDGKCHLADQLDIVEEDTDTPFSETTVITIDINPILVCCLNDFKPAMNLTSTSDIYFVDEKLCNGYTSILAPPPKA